MLPNTLTDGIQGSADAIALDRSQERDVVYLINHGMRPGALLFYRGWRSRPLPAQGEMFPVPRKYANALVMSHHQGALSIQGRNMQVAPTGPVIPEGYKLVPIEPEEGEDN